MYVNLFNSQNNSMIKYYYYSHFMDEKIEKLKNLSKVIQLGKLQKWDLSPGS